MSNFVQLFCKEANLSPVSLSDSGKVPLIVSMSTYEDFLDSMLVEQLMHGLESQEMCDEIIAKKLTTFKATLEVANSLEATRHMAKEVRTARPSSVADATYQLGSRIKKI